METPQAPANQPASNNLLPENILGQQISVASKNKEASDLKEAVEIFGKTINSAISEIKELLKPKDPPQAPPPAVNLEPEIIPPPAKKSAFKTIEEEINKSWGF